MDADLVIFNPDTITDCADYTDPFKEPKGINYVIVDGKVVLDHQEFTGKSVGKVLRRK